MKTSKYKNLIRINLLTWIIAAITMGFSVQSNAQSGNKNALLQMIEEDRTTIDAIAGYDENVRIQILQVAQTPEVLNNVEELQKRSQNQFRSIINDYNREAQAALYDMARYPNLISDLVRNGKPSSPEIDFIVSNYPNDIHAVTKQYARQYYPVLLRIDRLNNEIDRAFQLHLEPYDSRTRESVNVLLAYPEIVSVLVEDMAFTSLLGRTYREDPNWVLGNLNQISQQLAEQNREDLDAYKNQIQNDPQAYNEMLDASERFARENNEVRYLERSSDPIVEVRYVNSYPYWFGYPYWYAEPYWRPRPVYYHTGFYRNNFGSVVFVGLPSYHFIHWQTRYHPTSYPHLSYNYYNYYENHYAKRYRDAHRPVPHHGFYRSIERNVINNPRVNNSNLAKIDRQRGNNIVRRPNTTDYGSSRRGSSGVTRQGEASNSRQGVGTSNRVNRQSNETMNRNGNVQRSNRTPNEATNKNGSVRNNSGTSGSNANRRQYNTTSPGRSEGSYNSKGPETGRGSVLREATPVTTSPVKRSTDRSRNENATNNSRYERPRINGTNNGRSGDNTSPSQTRQRTSSDNMGNGVQQQRSAAPQQRREASTPAERIERAAPARENQRSERTAAPQRNETPSAPAQRSGRSEQQPSRSSDSQSTNNRADRDNRSSTPAVSTEDTKRERGNGRQR